MSLPETVRTDISSETGEIELPSWFNPNATIDDLDKNLKVLRDYNTN